MGAYVNIIGKKFGKLTVVSFYGYNPNYKRKQEMYLCKCDCGNETIANKDSLLKGDKKSCGCIIGKNNFQDLSGKRFGNLTVIKRVNNSKNNKPQWLCKCDCGNFRIVRSDNLKSGRIISCGCKNICKQHRKRYTRLYTIWDDMKTRCYNSNSPNYKYYGKLGVSICEEWKNNFESFYNWAMSNGYEDSLTIDRINPFANYEPSNCRWATYEEQAANKRKNYKE